MISLAKLVAGSQLTGSVATYYTATNKTATIKNATAVNTTAGAVTITVYIVASGGSATSSNIVISAKSIAAGETYNCPELIGKVVALGGTIQALASSATSITFMVDGLEVT